MVRGAHTSDLIVYLIKEFFVGVSVCNCEWFLLRFFDKTKNEWTHRANFEKVPGKYDMVFMDYSSHDKVRKTHIVNKLLFKHVYKPVMTLAFKNTFQFLNRLLFTQWGFNTLSTRGRLWAETAFFFLSSFLWMKAKLSVLAAVCTYWWCISCRRRAQHWCQLLLRRNRHSWMSDFSLSWSWSVTLKPWRSVCLRWSSTLKKLLSVSVCVYVPL